MKKSVFTVVCFLIILTMVGIYGCSGDNQTKPEESNGQDNKTEEEQKEDVSLVLSRWAGDPYEAATYELCKRFTKETGINVEIDAVPWENLREKQALEMASKNGTYDILYLHPFWFSEFVSNGYVVDLTDKLGAGYIDEYVPSLMDTSKADGKIYGIPEWIGTILLAYRTDLFKEADIAPPSGWDDILNAARHFKSEDMYGISFPAKKGGTLGDVFSSLLAGTGTWYYDNDGNIAIDTAQAVEAAQFVLDLSGYAAEGLMNFHWDETVNIAMTGKTPMVICMSSNASWLDDPEKSQTVGLWDYVPLSYKGNPGGIIVNYTWSVASDSEYQAEAIDLIKFLSETPQQIYLTKAQGTCGATKGYYEDSSVIELLPSAQAMNQAFTNGMQAPSWGNWPEQQEVLETELQNMIADRQTPEAVIKALAAKMSN